MEWSYVFLALTHRYNVACYNAILLAYNMIMKNLGHTSYIYNPQNTFHISPRYAAYIVTILEKMAMQNRYNCI